MKASDGYVSRSGLFLASGLWASLQQLLSPTGRLPASLPHELVLQHRQGWLSVLLATDSDAGAAEPSDSVAQPAS